MMTYQDQGPGLLSLYGRALLPKRRTGSVDAGRIPQLEAEIIGMQTDTPDLYRYSKLCGFAARTSVPVTWPHILAFPLHLKLLTNPAFLLPLLGLVHLRNEITQYRPIGVGERLNLTVRLGNEAETDRGLEFDLIAEARAGGKLVWQEASTTLHRRSGSAQKKKTGRPSLEQWPNTIEVKAPGSIGRQYGRLSGDMNPIHMHALTARAFGFPRAIAHGMWSKARCLALLSQQEDWRSGAVTIGCDFKKPFFLPGTGLLNWKENGKYWDYQLLNSKGDAPHLTGFVRWQ
ncbi:MaoC family dehydratase [Marinobacter salicampi]|uniref:MaoC family dehydratase n=1 Tax=Marinobacter salicampi TaxID=435907 RepID=UPI00140DAB41|nr:MaoC/PaaZ C-terminal domain-containing protein [Marinobacter salicampi]